MKLQGISACPGIVRSEAYVLLDENDDVSSMEEGQILVMRFSTPMYFEHFLKAGGIITETGGITCHAASLARDLNIPCVVSVADATQIIHTGDIIIVNADQGVVYA